MGFFIFILAILLGIFLLPLGIIYSFVEALYKRKLLTALKRLDRLFFAIALSLDQLGNVTCKELFNDVLIKHSKHKFGNPDETISSVLGKNKKAKTLTILGKILSWILDTIDKNHVIKSIEQ